MGSVSFIFGILGFVFALNAISSANAAEEKVKRLERRLAEAGLLELEVVSEA